MATILNTVATRDKLKARREPYWQKLDSGCMLGFRKMTPSSAGSWSARYRNAGSGERPKLTLGEFSDQPPSERFSAAKKAAETWFGHLGRGGVVKPMNVRQACETYVAHVRADRGHKPADDLEMRFKRWIYDDKNLSGMDLSKLTKTRVETWRKAMAATPAKVNRDDRDIPVTRPRAASSVNRDMAALRAALNFAYDAGNVTSDLAWRVALRPIKNADGRRDVYLDRDQRRALVAKSPAELSTFLRGLSLVPLRPGALAQLTVGNLDMRLGVVTIGKDKAGRDRKIKLPAATATFFAEQTTNKLPSVPLFARADGKPWNKDAWKWPVKEAAAAANLPGTTTTYTMRHSVITDLVTGGLDLLTIALLSGTSVAMIERHYGHLRADHAAAALAALAL